MFYFCKMQATGNDFIIVDYMHQEFNYSFKLLAEFLCNRHFGVGADGILILDKSEIADYKMRIFNSDGSEAEMCGNGIRCFAKYLYEHDLINKEEFEIETLSGIKKVSLDIEGKTVICVTVQMGSPELDIEKIPVILEEELGEENKMPIAIDIDNMKFYPISMGNPHVVSFVENVQEINIYELGKKIENYKFFPNKTNVEFVQIINDGKIKVRIWERGVGETLSCGTGVCASGVISCIIKSTKSDLIVETLGGNLNILYDNEKNLVSLKGEAKEVFEGKLII